MWPTSDLLGDEAAHTQAPAVPAEAVINQPVQQMCQLRLAKAAKVKGPPSPPTEFQATSLGSPALAGKFFTTRASWETGLIEIIVIDHW